MNVSFDKHTTATPAPIDVEVLPDEREPVVPAATIPTAPANQAVIVAPPRQLPEPTTPNDVPAFSDEDIGFDDIMLPRINIVQGVGDLSTVFNPGEIVLNQSLVIHVPSNTLKKIAGEPPLSFTVIGFKKRQFVEKTVGGALGNLFGSEAEVVRAGGTLDFKEAKSTGKTLYQRLATALILVQKPEHYNDEDNITFPHECEGKYYALALWSMKGTAYTNAAKIIYTARKLGHLKKGYSTQAWSLTTKLQEYFGNFAHIPVIRPGLKNSEAFMDFVQRVLTSGD